MTLRKLIAIILILLALIVIFTISFVTRRHYDHDNIWDAIQASDMEEIRWYAEDNPKLLNGSSRTHGSPLAFRDLPQNCTRYASIVNILLKAGADPNGRSLNGLTAIHYAVQRDCLGVVQILLKNKANPNLKRKPSFRTTSPLHDAKSSYMAEILIEAGAEINALDGLKRTPLHDAINDGRSAVAGFLLKNGADLYAHDELGQRPVDLWREDESTLKILIAYGLDVPPRASRGRRRPSA